MKIRSGCEGGGKGALLQKDKSATLATNNDQYLFQPMSPTFIIDNIGGQAEYGKASSVNGTLRAGGQGAIVYSFDSLASNSMKSKNPFSGCREVEVAKTLDTTDPNPNKNQGGIAVVEPAKVSIGLNGESQVSPTLIARMSSAVGTTQDGLILCEEVTPIHDQATRFSGKRGDKADGKGNGLGIGEAGDPMNTLTGGDRHAVAYSLDRASFNQGKNAQFGFSVLEEQQPTLTAKGLGATCANYIVRRLTPIECARLQGFADWWGVVEPKDTLTNEEYRFWLEVRNTHALINGRKVQDYTPKQMLSWYNKLWTDSAEYKMWGNGIALPTALYALQGIVEALNGEEEDAWMS
jgi:DNA (cytosine-5)-methyltransferase 1